MTDLLGLQNKEGAKNIRPFLKWAGGKYQILHHIKAIMPLGKRLIEPFVGSGAVFLNTQYSDYLLADANQDLIFLYQHLQQEGEHFIKFCRQFFSSATNQEDCYYKFRDQFNQNKDTRLKSALFIYLNRHGYNGLCRYSASGTFNVPFGAYQEPKLFENRMQYFHQKSQKSEFIHADFLITLDQARKGDVIYCDPPYVSLSKTASFTAYHSLMFDEDKQIALANMAIKLKQKNIPVLISNHDTPFTRKLYQKAKIITFEVPRVISCNYNKRKKVKELLALFI